MFYRLVGPQYPRGFDQKLDQSHGDAILCVYRKMDSIIGKVSNTLTQGYILFLVSDHGFHTWRKEFNTNIWLLRRLPNLMANLKKWSGGHCSSDASDTWGIFLSNRKVGESNPNVLDTAPALYRLFGAEI